MKLILSSCDFGNEKSKKCITDNLEKPISKCRVLFIPNEKATPEVIASDLYYKRVEAFGFTRQNIYVFDHSKADNFKNLDIDCIYVSGGNTFGTLDKIRKCGFDKNIVEYVKSGVVYIGGSAGAHIATRNIEHVQRYDSNDVYMEDFDSLGLLNGILICHYTYRRRLDYDELCREGKYKVYFLTDEDSLVYEE